MEILCKQIGKNVRTFERIKERNINIEIYYFVGQTRFSDVQRERDTYFYGHKKP